MSNFPALSEMDISRFDEISHYTLRQDRKDRDVLRIYYKRKKGSFLPDRKTFRFGRAAKMIAEDSAPNGSIEVFEISPHVLKVTAELDSIVKQHHSGEDQLKLLLRRVDQLETEVQGATEEIRAIIKSLKDCKA